MNFPGVLEAVLDFLNCKRRRHALVGALAMACHGLQRATGDIDLMLDFETQADTVAFLESLGYETLHRSDGYSTHIHPLDEMGRPDVLYVTEPMASEIFEKARTVSFAGRAVPVPRPEHLAAMKVFAIRNDSSRTFQEMADIQFILELPGVDREEIRSYFVKHDLEDRYDEICRIIEVS